MYYLINMCACTCMQGVEKRQNEKKTCTHEGMHTLNTKEWQKLEKSRVG